MQCARNRVLEVRRFTDIQDWFHVDSKNIIAELGIRRGSKLVDVKQDSERIKE